MNVSVLGPSRLRVSRLWLGTATFVNHAWGCHEFVLDTVRRAILGGALRGGLQPREHGALPAPGSCSPRAGWRYPPGQADCLVVFRPHIGAVVHELDLGELVGLYDIRKVLEPVAIRRAASRITAEEVAGVQALAEAMERESDPGEWAELNRQFHAAVERAAHAPLSTQLSFAGACGPTVSAPAIESTGRC